VGFSYLGVLRVSGVALVVCGDGVLFHCFWAWLLHLLLLLLLWGRRERGVSGVMVMGGVAAAGERGKREEERAYGVHGCGLRVVSGDVDVLTMVVGWDIVGLIVFGRGG